MGCSDDPLYNMNSIGMLKLRQQTHSMLICQIEKPITRSIEHEGVTLFMPNTTAGFNVCPKTSPFLWRPHCNHMLWRYHVADMSVAKSSRQHAYQGVQIVKQQIQFQMCIQ